LSAKGYLAGVVLQPRHERHERLPRLGRDAALLAGLAGDGTVIPHCHRPPLAAIP
jgi:hypothetical protein